MLSEAMIVAKGVGTAFKTEDLQALGKTVPMDRAELQILLVAMGF